MDTDSICNPGRLKKITEDPHDIVGEQLENQVRDENYNRVEQNNNINKIQEKINTNTSDYLQNCFDQMNKDCFYIEPLLIPTQPFDSYNSEDPISKFMDKL